MTRGKRNQVSEPLERDNVAIVHQIRDGLLEGNDRSQSNKIVSWGFSD